MASFALLAPAQDGGGGQSAGRDRGRVPAQQWQQWFLSGRTPPSGSAAERLLRAREQDRSAAASADARETSRFLQLQWTGLGPAPLDSDPTLFQSYGYVSGRVTAVAVDQKDATGNTIYIGAANGGVWKSTNAAALDPNAVAWQPLTDAEASLAIGALAIQPGANGNVILAGTGEANQSDASYYGMGILRSSDAGQSWTLISAADNGASPFRGLGFSRFAFHPGNPDVVVAAVGSTNGQNIGAELQEGAGRGLYISLNAGQAWSYAAVLDSGVLISPASATDVVFDAVHNKFYAAVRGHGYYESAGGQVWNRMAQQPGAGLSAGKCPAEGSSTCPLARARLTVRPDTGEVFTAWIDASETLSIYKLPSSGAAWQAMGKQGIDACGDPGGAGCGAEQGNANLSLKAVPNGSSTDLYFGAANLFKCSAGVLDPLCAQNTAWKNLTHVYGCSPLGAPAHVHPGQHAADYSAAFPEKIYFANDGGVYRTLSGFTMDSGECSPQNPFQNLNANLGALGRFTGLAQPTSDAGLLLGGTAANGSALFQASNAGGGALWRGVNLGDGGIAAIDPGDATVLYTSFPAGESVTIQRCAAGVNCRQNTWTNVVESGTLANDGSALFAPYVLDPRNPALLLVGTCRVWRGPAGGGTYTPLSGVLAGDGGTNCGGGTATGETKIRTIAAGGAAGAAGGAKVIYAGMVGRSGGAAGRIFVTTDADAGAAAWNDRTGGINPSAYDISEITVSPFDSSGQTAYAAIMGLGVAHVFKTVNAGVTWVNKSGNLPDVPVNSLAIDPANASLLYAGTDSGVFVSADDGASWARLGSGLPNVPVAKVLTFSAGNIRKLRAATIGRGVWQIDLPVVAVRTSPAALTLNPTVIGRSSTPQSVVLTNDSAASLVFTGIAVSGPFSLSHDCASPLLVGASCTLSLRSTPSATGSQNGLLMVNHTAGALTVPLSGTGVDFSLSLARPRRPSRSGGSAIVMDGDTLTIDVDLALSAPMAEGSIALSCTSSAPRLGCAMSVPEVNGGEPMPIRALIFRERARGRASRLQSPNGRKQGSYVITITAAAGPVVRVIQVQVNTR